MSSFKVDADATKLAGRCAVPVSVYPEWWKEGNWRCCKLLERTKIVPDVTKTCLDKGLGAPISCERSHCADKIQRSKIDAPNRHPRAILGVAEHTARRYTAARTPIVRSASHSPCSSFPPAASNRTAYCREVPCHGHGFYNPSSLFLVP
jgi:hypothetical protein